MILIISSNTRESTEASCSEHTRVVIDANHQDMPDARGEMVSGKETGSEPGRLHVLPTQL